MKRYKLVVFLVCLPLIMDIVAFGAQSKSIRIGFLGDFTGVSKTYCTDAYNAANIAVIEINRQGGLLGRPVELIKRDAGISPKKHYELFRKLVLKDKVVAVFGGASSNCLVEASKASKELKTPYMISVGNSQKVLVEYGHPYVFMFEASSWMETKGFSVFATLMPWKRFAWIGPDYLWGREVLGYFKQHFAQIGNPIKWSAEVWHPLDSNDFTKQINAITQANPDAMVIASWGKDMKRFVKQADSQGLFDKMASFGWFMAEEPSLELPEGVWTLTRASYSFLSKKYPQTREFGEKFIKFTGKTPAGFAVCSYDSVLAWQQAVLKAKSSKPGSLASALRGLTFTGLRGESFVREIDGQMNASTYFGRLVYLQNSSSSFLDSVIEIPATKTWLTEAEVLERRKTQQK